MSYCVFLLYVCVVVFILYYLYYHITTFDFFQKELKGNGGRCELDRRPNDDVVRQLEEGGANRFNQRS